MPNGERRLAAIMFTDVVGYSTLTQRNELDTIRLLEEHRELLRPLFASHGGREIKTIGDAFLIEFQSALDAVLCAVAVQQMMHDRKVARGDTLQIRIGVHVGDVLRRDGDILGDAVNIASRIEPLAEPGGVCVSGEVYDQIRNKSDLSIVSLGRKSLKNVQDPQEVYAVNMPWHSVLQVTPAYAASRIAILPFRNMSPDPGDEYLAEGMTEEIISTVSGISGLSVISRTSVMGYKGTTKKVDEIGKELRAGSILEGSFRKAGNRIRVTTQLIDVAEDKHLWAENYDRNLDDVFAVQSDVARRVAEALRVRILVPEKERIEKKPTESTIAYTLYLKGKYHLNKRGLEDLRRAREYFELAIHEDPLFALGYIGISDSCLVLRNNWGDEPLANFSKAKAMLDRALELDSTAAEAHATRGLVLLHEYDLRGAEKEFGRALESKPSYAIAHMWYYLLLSYQLRWDEARRQIEKAMELDPLAPVVYGNLGGYYFYTKDYKRAVEAGMKAADLGYTPVHLSLAQAYGKMRKFEDMKRELDAFVKLNEDSLPFAQPYADIWGAYLTDDKKTVTQLLPKLETRHYGERGPSATDIGAFYFYVGEDEKAFEWFERAYSRKEPDLLYLKIIWYVFFDRECNDLRYLNLLKRLGLEQNLPSEQA